MSERARAERLLEVADDELILGWRDSEWTGIAPFLEEDVALSSIAQNEIGHARALYELAAAELGTTADALAFDRSPAEYRCAPLVELRLVPDWARTIARRVLYEAADELRLAALKDDPRSRGRGPRGEDRPRGGLPPHARRDVARAPARRAALPRGDGRALAVRARPCWPEAERPRLAERFGRDLGPVVERGSHTDELAPLWDEMTIVRRSAPAGAAW